MTTHSIVKILSIDGGGVRGYIPCMFLKHLRLELNEAGYTTPFYHMFDLFAGTSTGALIALMLSSPPDSIQDIHRLNLLLDLYENDTKKIFPPRHSHPFNQQLIRPKHNGKALKRVLRKYFKSYTLKDVLTNLIIPSFDMTSMSPFFFKHRPLYSGCQDDLNFFLKDVGLAASAAPTFLPPVNIRPIPDNKQNYCFIDGGIYSNNPSLCAYIEARKLYPNAKKYLVFSIGTGGIHRSFECKKVKHWGIMGWMNPFDGVPLITTIMYSQQESIEHMLRYLPSIDFYRFDISLQGSTNELDDASDRYLTFLKGKSAEMILNYKNTIPKIINLLTS